MQTKTAFAKHRQNRRLTLGEVAAQFKVNRTTILRWENGTTPIPDDRIEEIEAATGISRHALRPDLAALFASPKPEQMSEAS